MQIIQRIKVNYSSATTDWSFVFHNQSMTRIVTRQHFSAVRSRTSTTVKVKYFIRISQFLPVMAFIGSHLRTLQDAQGIWRPGTSQVDCQHK